MLINVTDHSGHHVCPLPSQQECKRLTQQCLETGRSLCEAVRRVALWEEHRRWQSIEGRLKPAVKMKKNVILQIILVKLTCQCKCLSNIVLHLCIC